MYMLDDILKQYGAEEVEALEVYQDIFRLGEGYIQSYKGDSRDFKANPLGYARKNGAKKGKYRIMFEDTFEDTLRELQESDFAIINGLSYFGRKNLQEHASKMYAMIFDLDGVDEAKLNNFLSGAINGGAYPIPNYIALSGHGIHLYYVFEEPISLYPNTKVQLKTLKYELTKRIWNKYTSTLEDKQIQGINQGFRVIGGKTKIDGVRGRAFRLNTHPFNVEELTQYIPEEIQIDFSQIYKESKLTLSEAKEKYPVWYEKRVLNKEPKKHWTCKRDLYEWWKRKILEGAIYHHRYFCIMCLAIYGVKCGVPEEEVKRDSLELIPFLNEIYPEEPFTEEDCFSALECYDERYITYPIDTIINISAINMTKNKRNGRKQKTQLKIARSTLEVLNEERGKALQGRKSKEPIIKEWRSINPTGTKEQCIEETKLSKSTVYKHWKD